MTLDRVLSERSCPGPLAPFGTNLVRAGAAAPVGFEPVDRASVADQVGRFQRWVGAARPPACSFWAQVYFNALIIPGLCLLRSSAGVSCLPRAVEFCPTSGLPLRFLLHDVDASRPACGATALLDHVDAMVDDLHAIGRVSRRMLWESAERTAAWTLAQIGVEDPAGADAAAALLAGVRPGRMSVGSCRASGPETVRRYCCLRYHLPGGAQACGGACPRAVADASGPPLLTREDVPESARSDGLSGVVRRPMALPRGDASCRT